MGGVMFIRFYIHPLPPYPVTWCLTLYHLMGLLKGKRNKGGGVKNDPYPNQSKMLDEMKRCTRKHQEEEGEGGGINIPPPHPLLFCTLLPLSFTSFSPEGAKSNINNRFCWMKGTLL